MFLSNCIKSELFCYQNCYQKLSFYQVLSCKVNIHILLFYIQTYIKVPNFIPESRRFHHVPFLYHCTVAFIKLSFGIISLPALKNVTRSVHKKHSIARIYGSLNQIGCSINEDPWEDFHLDLCIRKSFLTPMQLIFYLMDIIKL